MVPPTLKFKNAQGESLLVVEKKRVYRRAHQSLELGISSTYATV
uniref:Uncharacterized protein n=1 Tax=Arundo donax TaxID=35708 RepID=A0A0A9ADB3_ARUDO